MPRALVDRPLVPDTGVKRRRLPALVALPLRRLQAGLDLILTTAIVWKSRKEQRRILRRLDAKLLSDIDVSREWRRRESRKPFWRG